MWFMVLLRKLVAVRPAYLSLLKQGSRTASVPLAPTFVDCRKKIAARKTKVQSYLFDVNKSMVQWGIEGQQRR